MMGRYAKVDQYLSPPLGWDDWLEEQGDEGAITQTSLWAALKKEQERSQFLFLRAWEDNRIVAQCLIETRKVKRRGLTITEYECLGGPVISSLCDEQKILKLLLEYLSKKLSALKLAKMSFLSFPRNRLARKVGVGAYVFPQMGFKSREWATYVVDLSASEKDLFAGLSNNCRSKIRKAQKMGLRIEKCNNFSSYKKNVVSVLSGAGIKTKRSDDWLRIFFENEISKKYDYLVAFDNSGRRLAVSSFYSFHNISVRLGSGITGEARDKRIPAQDYLTWTCILKAKENGSKWFDLAGVNPEPKSIREKGIRDFKAKWGGEYVKYNSYYRASSMLNALRFIRRVLNKIKLND